MNIDIKKEAILQYEQYLQDRELEIDSDNLSEHLKEAYKILQEDQLDRSLFFQKISQYFQNNNLPQEGLHMLKTYIYQRQENEQEIKSFLDSFLKYINIISKKSHEEQGILLQNFPPNDQDEYECFAGTSSRLANAIQIVSNTPLICRAHERVIENYNSKLDGDIHGISFISFLLGVDFKILLEIDHLLMTFPDQTVTKSNKVFEIIQDYEADLEKSYREIREEKKQQIITNIIAITDADNEESKFSRGDILQILQNGLEIGESQADEIIE